MFDEVIAKIRGVHEWPETAATVASVTRYEVSVGKYGTTQARSRLSFWYRDGEQNIQSGEFSVDEDSPLFSEEKGSTFAIQYNPKHPDRYWCGEYSPTYDNAMFIAVGLLIAIVVLAVVLMK